jgi:hypothetical protein
MKELKQKAEKLTDHVTEYVETYVAYSVLKATDKAAGVASGGITAVIVGVMAFFFLLFAGFGIVAGFFALAMIILLALKKNVLAPYFRNLIIKATYE